MKVIPKFFLLLLFFGVFVSFVSTPIHAALVPCGTSDTVVGGYLQGECNLCDLQLLALNLLNFLVLATAIVAALLFLNAGFLYITSSANPGNISKAHKIFGTTLVGMIIVFAAWLIVGQIMAVLHTGSPLAGARGDWNTILDGCQNVTPTPNTPPSASPPPASSPPITTPPPPPGTATEDGARTILGDAGVTVNAQPPQTTLVGLQPTTVAGAIGLKEALGIPMVITGGTESTGGHVEGEVSHGSGHKLDYGTNSNPNLTPEKMESVLPNKVTRNHGGVVEDGYVGYINGRRVSAYLEDVGTPNEHWDVIYHEGI